MSLHFFLHGSHINDMQHNSIQNMLQKARGMSRADLTMRYNGNDLNYQMDWLKHLVQVPPLGNSEVSVRLNDALELEHMLDRRGVPTTHTNGERLSLKERVFRMMTSQV